MKHLLIIEDDVFLREMYVHIFEREGYTIDQAGDGEEGITKARADTSYDLILLDIMLPKKSGIEVLQALKQPPDKAIATPILLLSNLGQESVIQEAYNIGAIGYILKADLLPQQVYERVRDYLDGKLTSADLQKSKSMD